ncbi:MULTISPECIES: flagellar biosynthetic protein FliO [Chromobacterium]|uniref:flagellar biosynthetic protein FliO n=1 Tax=Chromobacterium TaxID=535 RepID=UPI0020BE8630|nr:MULTISPECIES: flagellar biosynthetic protein FliO [Chromobacterium]
MMGMKYALALMLCVHSISVAAGDCAAGASAPGCAVSASEPARARLQFRSDPPAASGGLLGPYEMLGGLALIGAAACWWRLRHQRFGQAGLGSEDLRVVGKCRLSARSTVYVVQHRDREIMLAESEHGITVVRDELKA